MAGKKISDLPSRSVTGSDVKGGRKASKNAGKKSNPLNARQAARKKA
jgi:hypothetical protein